MSELPFTRRSLLAASAGVLAGGLLHPGGALAALAGPARPRMGDRRLGRLAVGARTVELGSVADLVALQWQAPARAQVSLRFRTEDGGWSPWVSAGARGHGPPLTPGAGAVGEPIWTGGTRALEIRANVPLHDVLVHLVDVRDGVGARRRALAAGSLASSAALPRATPVLAAGPGQPPILARRGWAQNLAPPSVAPAYGVVRMAFVHHTENPNGYSAGEVPAMLRAIYAFHRYTNGWDDIGYNFVIDAYGRIFEARAGGIDEPVVGAHAGGYNLLSTGVAMLGSFMGSPITPAARGALESLLAWKLSLHGLPAEGRVAVRVNPAGAVYSRYPANARVSLQRISGHRDGDSTDCPGNVLYGELPGIRAAVAKLAPRPARLTLTLASAPTPVPPSTPGSTPAPAGPTPAPGATGAPPSLPTLTGALRFLDGSPIAGAQIVIQARTVARRGELVSERTLGGSATDATGAFAIDASLPGVAQGVVHLRALFEGSSAAGASVSEPLRMIATAPVSPPPPAPGPTPPAPAPPTS
jgi:hypothetical protein